MEERFNKLEEKVDTIMGNHLPHLKEDMAELKFSVIAVRTNVEWLMKTYWVVVSASIGSLVAAIMGLILK